MIMMFLFILYTKLLNFSYYLLLLLKSHLKSSEVTNTAILNEEARSTAASEFRNCLLGIMVLSYNGDNLKY